MKVSQLQKKATIRKMVRNRELVAEYLKLMQIPIVSKTEVIRSLMEKYHIGSYGTILNILKKCLPND